MKTAVKYLSFVISVALLLTCFSFPGAVFAEQDGIFIYRAEGNTAVLTGIDSSASGEIVVPASLDGLTVVMVDGAFKNRSDITSVVLPDTVEVITAESFAYCNYLTSITLPANLVMIGESAFCACILLDNVVLPDSITTLGQYAFAWCEALTSINIPSALRNIKRGTFTGCVSLATIEVGENISTIEQDAFANTAFYRDESNWEDGVLYLEYYVIKARESISGRCTLRENAKLIGEFAFIKCGLTELVVYGDLRTVNSSAFSMCNYLTDIYYSGDEDGRRRIWVSSKNNYAFTKALWHYGYDPDLKEYAPGDINGDDEVNNKDLLRLFKYLSEWDVEVIDDVLDVNKDGSNDNRDLTRLMQYLSGWNVSIYSKTTGGSIGGGDHGPIIEF